MNLHYYIAVLSSLLYSSQSLFAQSAAGDSASFTFPLEPGDQWFYGVSNDMYPGVHWGYTTTIKIESDTMMPNTKVYFQLDAMEDRYGTPVQSKLFFRKDGSQIFEYSLEDSIEYLRFNFAAKVGDTISSIPFNPYSGLSSNSSINMTLLDIDSSYYFGFIRKTYNFSGTLVADSLGIIRQTDGMLSRWVLIGAELKGKDYGVILATHDNPFRRPSSFSLYQNYPNPFNPTTIIPFDLPQNETICVSIYDCLGREVLSLAKQSMSPGHHEITLNAENLPSGFYFYRITSQTSSFTKKMLLLK